MQLRGVDPYDPEALASGSTPDGRPALFLGDIGDNRARRPDISVFRFAEPRQLADQTVATDVVEARLPRRAQGRRGSARRPGRRPDLDRHEGRVRRRPLPGPAPASRTDRVNTLERVGDVPGLVTDGAFLPDGRFVLRSYTMAYLYDGPNRLTARSVLPDQPQGESLAVDGDRLLVGSEGRKSAVYAVPLPGGDSSEEPSGSASASAPAADQGSRARPDDGVSWAAVGLSLLGTAVVAGALARLLRRRGRPRR